MINIGQQLKKVARRKHQRHKPGKAQTIYGAARAALSGKPPRQERLIEQDFLTALQYQLARESNPVLDAIERQAVEGGIGTFPPLMEDVFSSLYQRNTQVGVPEQEEFALNKRVLEQMHGLEDFEEAKMICAGNVVTSAIYSQAIDEWAIRYIQEIKEKVEKQDKKNEERDKQGKKPIPDPPDAIVGQDMKIALGEAMQKANEQVAAVDAVQQMFPKENSGWGSEGPDPQRVETKERIKLAQQYLRNPKLMEIIELAGRLSRAWSRIEYTKCEGIEEVVEVELGKDLDRMVPQAFDKLAWDRDGFYDDFTEGKLPQIETEGREPQSKGPVIVLIDQSGSMKGERDKDAKALMFAAMITCRKERRDFGYVPFATSTGKVREFPKGKISLREATEMVSEFLNGGTNYWRALQAGLGIIKRNRHFHNADILMISDDCCQLPEKQVEQFAREQEELSFKVAYLVVGRGSKRKTALDDIADPVLFVDTLKNPKAGEAIRKMLNRK